MRNYTQRMLQDISVKRALPNQRLPVQRCTIFEQAGKPPAAVKIMCQIIGLRVVDMAHNMTEKKIVKHKNKFGKRYRIKY